jgi:DNA-binding NtrC family response regulator
MKVLCVDDDPFNLTFFVEATLKLEIPDLEALTAVSGKAALELLDSKRIDFMILDNKLPDISGIEVLQQCKRSHPTVEVLMVTGHASIEMAVEAMKEGARDFIEKPIRLALLHEKMLNIIDLLKRAREAEECRCAKETIEAGAQHDIWLLENGISAMKQCQDQVMGIIESGCSDSEKIERIKQEICRFKGRMC